MTGDAEKHWLRGACRCGAVTYRVADAFQYAMNCHCSQCRRMTGAAFKPFGGIDRSLFDIRTGDADLLRLGDGDDHDLLCGKCGSFLGSTVPGNRIHVTYGSLLDSPSLRPTAHIHVASKAAWFDITDDLPRYDELPDE